MDLRVRFIEEKLILSLFPFPEHWCMSHRVQINIVWKSSCMDRKKTSNWTRPNCSPVYVTAANQAVVDRFSCLLHSFKQDL
jgi:hypothetical protein